MIKPVAAGLFSVAIFNGALLAPAWAQFQTSADVLAQTKQALRKPAQIPRQRAEPTGLLMDIVVEGLCTDNGLGPVIRQFIDDRFRVGPLIEEKRGAALVLKVQFADAKEKKPATIPLILLPPKGAKDAQGNDIPAVMNCEGKVVGSLPAYQPLSVSLEIKYSSRNFELSPVAQTALNALGSGLVAASVIGPHTAVAGSGILAFSSKLGTVTKHTEDFINLFKRDVTDAPASTRWEANVKSISYGGTRGLKLTKQFRDTSLDFKPGDLLTWKPAYRGGFGDANDLDVVYNKVGVKFGATRENPTPGNFRDLCLSLQDEVNKAYGTDPVAAAGAIYYYQVTNRAVFEPKKQTCLADLQIKALERIKLTKPPYEGAFDPKAAAQTEPPGGAGKEESVSSAEFDSASEMLEDFARFIKNAPSRAARGPAEARAVRTALLGLFTRDVIATAYGTDLLPNSERGVDSEIVIDHLLKWGDVSRFGCFGKPAPPNTRKSTAEGLILFSQRKLLALVKITKEPKKEIFAAMDIVKAREDDIKRLLGDRGGCGRLDEAWDPRVDFKKLQEDVVAAN
jgi:hypothetical protein